MSRKSYNVLSLVIFVQFVLFEDVFLPPMFLWTGFTLGLRPTLAGRPHIIKKTAYWHPTAEMGGSNVLCQIRVPPPPPSPREKVEKSGAELWKCMKTNIYISWMFLDHTGPCTMHGCLNIWELMVLWSLAHVSFNLWFQCLVFVLQVPDIQCSTSYSVWFVTLYNAI